MLDWCVFQEGAVLLFTSSSVGLCSKTDLAFYTNVWLCLINRWTGQYLFHIQLENKRRKCQSQSGVAWSHRCVVVTVFVNAGFSNFAGTWCKSPATSSICAGYFSCSSTLSHKAAIIAMR